MKIAVIGAGAMGCLYGAYLSRHHEVVMIGSRSDQMQAVQEQGIVVTESDGAELRFPDVHACVSGGWAEEVNLVILSVKSTCTVQAMEQNRKLFRPETLVMTLQNGAGNDRAIAAFVDPENIIISTSQHNSVNLGMGHIRHPASGVTTIGTNHSGAQDKVREVAAVLQQCGLETVIADDIQRIIWSKLLVNLSVNTFTAITETPIGYMVRNEHAWNFARRLIYEAIEVAEADGTYFDRREALKMVKQVCETAGDGYSSMYQDRKKRIRMEIDSINGAIVEQAKQYGVPTPYNTLIVDLIHAIEGAYDLYGDS